MHGLHNFSHWHTHSIKLKDGAIQKTGSGPAGGLSPTDIRTAYNVPTAVDGTGQTLGLFELDGYAMSDITAYEQQFSLPNVTLQNVLIDNASGTAGANSGEVTLDLELQMAIAPGISKIMVYEGPNSSQGMLDIFSKIANDNLAKSVSTSWGATEDSTDSSFSQTENTILKQMAAQGQSMFAATGDSGADDNGSSLSVDDPASQPYIVGVGGTKLSTNADGSYSKETAWGNDTQSPNSGLSGGGGGISAIWSQPTWQNGLATSQNLASATMRNVPDVSFDAAIETGYAIYDSGQWGEWGGTSCASPIWAAFTALVNQQRAANGLATVGFANPMLYQLGRSSRYNQDFHDINDGSTNGYYPTETGYDDATGWGSFNGQNLFEDMSQDNSPTGSVPTTASTNSNGC